MKQYNFDADVNREGTNALKYDVLEERFGRPDLLPLWVADMDFEAPPCVKEAIIERAKHGVFGYSCPSQAYYDSIINWVGKQHKWNINQEWITFIPGIVRGIAFVIDCFTKKGDKVIIQPPVYHPFSIVPTLHERELVFNHLECDGENIFRINFDLLRQQAKEAKLLILCNPHNPGGRVWTREELTEIAEICHENNLLVISDEIHSDLAFAPYTHVPFASVSEKAAQCSITFMAPSKTFNVAGIVSSFGVVPNAQLRETFFHYLRRSEFNEAHLYAYVVAQTVYTQGEAWLKEAKEYIWQNIQFVDKYLQTHLPKIKAILPQASFLIWLDCKELGLSQEELVSFFVNEAKLALNNGTMFGDGGEGYMRINVGTQRHKLEQALTQLSRAYTARFQ